MGRKSEGEKLTEERRCKKGKKKMDLRDVDNTTKDPDGRITDNERNPNFIQSKSKQT